MGGGLSERLKKLDQGSVSTEYRVYTVQGAVLSVATVLLVVYLVATEVYFNFQLTLHERVGVNATSSRGLEMEFDISFPDLSCSHVSIDAADPSGQSQSLHLDTDHHVWKHRFKMSEDGKHRVLIGSREKLELGSTMLSEEDLEEQLYEKLVDDDAGKKLDEEADEDECGSCYGAGEEDECCDTCEDVRRVYKRRGWVLQNLEEIKQCKHELSANQKNKEGAGEGCNVHGKVALSSGGGNLHLAPGQEFGMMGGTSGSDIFQMLLQQFQLWNVSHTVNKIRFGPEYPAAVYQLDGRERIIEDVSAMYQYYFQIVPTLYRFRNGTTIQTYQYSATEHQRTLNPGSSRGLPGVFFFYEVSPLHVEISEGYRKGWIAFFTSVCAIVGGVVTCVGMLDQWLFSHKDKRRDSLAFTSATCY